jgi:alpha-amylase
MIKELADRNQIELLSGGFYEPIMAVIPDEDKLNQINLLKDYIKKVFNLDSYGFWLAERVWEPYLPKILEIARLNYILIDDFHLKANGLADEDTFYPYITEEQGSKVVVVPINKELRYLTPWKKPEESLKYLEQFPTEQGDRLITLIDDAEKMGVWPAGDRTTYDICFGKGYDGTPWVPKFFELLEEADWLNIITIKEYLEKFKPKGLVYLPTASYDKMSYWVLPTNARKRLENLIKKAKNEEIPYHEDILEFAKGGFWRGFLVKYPESNAMHKKMLYIRNKLKLAEGLFGLSEKGEKIDAIKNAWRELYKGQSNDPYWHGQFGGIYFGFMRQSIYHHLIHAEKIAENVMKSYQSSIIPNIRLFDIDYCGREEILMETELLNLYINCFHGGSIFEIDEKKSMQNVLNVLQRRKEAYHQEDVHLPYDRWRKYALMDHFTVDSIDLINLVDDNYEELGNFVDSQYNYEIKQDDNKLIAKLWKDGVIKKREKNFKIKLLKNIEIENGDNEVSINYILKNLDKTDLEVNYLTEIPFYLSGDISKTEIKTNNSILSLDQDHEFSSSKIEVIANDLKLGLKITLDNEYLFFKYSLYTFISTDGSKDSLYQGTCLTLINPIKIPANEAINFQFKLKIFHLE